MLAKRKHVGQMETCQPNRNTLAKQKHVSQTEICQPNGNMLAKQIQVSGQPNRNRSGKSNMSGTQLEKFKNIREMEKHWQTETCLAK